MRSFVFHLLTKDEKFILLENLHIYKDKGKHILRLKSSPKNKNLGENKMKKLTIIIAAIVICFGITTNTFAQKNGGNGTAPVYLNVTIDNGTTEQPNAIRSDSDLSIPYS